MYFSLDRNIFYGKNLGNDQISNLTIFFTSIAESCLSIIPKGTYIGSEIDENP